MGMPENNSIPSGYRILEDDEIVKHGDVVLDYMTAEGFAYIHKDTIYEGLIGLNGDRCRMSQLCFEVFTKV